MLHKKSTIFLGDLACAIRELGTKDYSTQKLIAEMLGMYLEPPTEKVAPPEPQQQQQQQQPPPQQQQQQPEQQPQTSPVPESQPDSIPFDVESKPSNEGEWIPEVEPLPSARGDGEGFSVPTLEPLLLPNWTRGILSVALATRGESGALDVERIIETLARGESVRTLPTVSEPTLVRGVQLLVDKSQAMMPFAQDQVWMQREIKRVVGDERVEVLRFRGCPMRHPGVGQKTTRAYQPPPAGTPVVLLTDLGICQPMFSDDWASAGEWLDFCAAVRRANCPLVAFVPYGASRWPARLAKIMTIIQWDRSTTAATVAAIFGRGVNLR